MDVKGNQLSFTSAFLVVQCAHTLEQLQNPVLVCRASRRTGLCRAIMGWLEENRNAVYYATSFFLVLGTWKQLHPSGGGGSHQPPDDVLASSLASSRNAFVDDQPLAGLRRPMVQPPPPPPLPALPLPGVRAHPATSAHTLAPPAYEAAPPKPGACQFTHVFSPYRVTDSEVLGEYRRAEHSWVRPVQTNPP